MKEVSQFELVYKPQSPTGAADIVLQGYFLNITNLERVELFFRLDLITSPISDPDRSLSNNTTVIIDTPNNNNQSGSLTALAGGGRFRLNPTITIPAEGTAKVLVLPSDPFTMPGGTPNFETRGYVTIRLPAERTGPSFFDLAPQLEGPARVLVTPQNRATYLDSEGNITDQTQSSVPTGSGSAVIELEPERRITLDPVFVDPGSINRLPDFDFRRIDGLGVADLAAMMAAAQASDLDLERFNEALREAGVDITLQQRARS